MFRKLCVLVAVGVMVLSSGCCFRRCGHRPWFRNRGCCAPVCCEPVSCCHPGGVPVAPPGTMPPPLALPPR